MAPFHELTAQKCDNTAGEQTAAIQELLQHPTCKLFVSVSNLCGNNNACRLTGLAIDFLVQSLLVNILGIPGNAWMVITMRKTEDIARLLAQRIIMDSICKHLVVSRR